MGHCVCLTRKFNGPIPSKVYVKMISSDSTPIFFIV